MADLTVKLREVLPNVFEGNAHELLVAVYKNEDLPLPTRIDAAKAAIAHETPKLAAIEHSGNQDKPIAINVMSGVTREDDDDDTDTANGHASH